MTDSNGIEITYDDTLLWRAIDLIVQEIGPLPHTSQWFRDEWEKLVREKKAQND